MMRVGVIDTGAMKQHHVRIYSEMDNVELVGIFNVDEKHAGELTIHFPL